jgi:membrane-bound lytic murein transglycosylase B
MRQLPRQWLASGPLLIAAALQAAAQMPTATPANDPRPPFPEFVATLKADALTRGIRPEVVEQAFEGIDRVETVLERDRSQAEFTLTFAQYVDRRLTRPFVKQGRQEAAANRGVLSRVSDRYGVPPHVVLAVWGLESNFGRFSGVRPTIPVLATLAYDPRRSDFFRGELFDALEIVNRGDVGVAGLKGSWAGAMGQPQFMPSSYLKYAADFDGDGRRNIWTSRPDVFASIANYLKEHGWVEGRTWGREVSLARARSEAIEAAAPLRETGCKAERDMTEMLPLSKWKSLGVTLPGGGRLPSADLAASLVRTETRAFLVYANYHALLDYNCAHHYALSVGLLADRVAAR